MEPFDVHTGLAVPLPRVNIDTTCRDADAITAFEARSRERFPWLG